jgi:hypothetical protein
MVSCDFLDPEFASLFDFVKLFWHLFKKVRKILFRTILTHVKTIAIEENLDWAHFQM